MDSLHTTVGTRPIAVSSDEDESHQSAVQCLLSKFESDPSSGRIVPMEGLRGFAALLVFLVHFRALFGHYAEGTALFPVVGILGSLGHSGVDLFFILSGYLIYGIVMDRRFRFWRFFYRRVQRLYPTFLVVFAVCLAASFFLPSRSKLPSSWREAIAYVAANLLMLPGMLPIKPLITVAWSLSYEWFFYLLMPASAALLRIRDWSGRWRVTFLAVLFVVLLAAATEGIVYNSRLVLFGAGILLWEFLQRTGIPAALPRWGEFVAAALYGLNLLVVGLIGRNVGSTVLALEKTPKYYIVSLFITGFLITLYSIPYRGFLGLVFSWKPLRWIGNMSYSYYLIHGLTLVSIEIVARWAIHSNHLSVPAFVLLFVFCVAATFVTSGALYLSVERPLSLRRTSQQAAVAPASEAIAVASAAQQDFAVY
jgi:exopolysaccharide production protein ExoZ